MGDQLAHDLPERRIGEHLHRALALRLLWDRSRALRAQGVHLVDEGLRREQLALFPGEHHRLFEADRDCELLRRAREIFAKRLDVLRSHGRNRSKVRLVLKLWRRAFVIASLLLATSACGRGCTCFSGEKTYESLDGKVKVTLVRKTHWAGGKVPGPISDFFVRVDTEPPFDEEVGCDHIDMAEDKEGKNVAFRCKGKPVWTVLRLRGGDRRIRECNAPVGTDKKPKFEALEPIKVAARHILECERVRPSYQLEQVIRALVEDSGPDPAIDLLMELSAKTLASPSAFDAWDSGRNALDKAAHAKLMTKLCTTLTKTQDLPSYQTYVRAALRCPIDSPAIADGALAMFKKSIADASIPTKEPDPSSAAHRAAAFSATLALPHPKEAGAIACDAAPKGPRGIIGGVLAITKTPCLAIDAWLTPDGGTPLCNEVLDCGDAGLCKAADLAPSVEGISKLRELPGDGGLRDEVLFGDDQRLQLAAAYVKGPLPPMLLLANQRRNYTFEQGDAGSSTTACDDDNLDAGAPCKCNFYNDWYRCALEKNAKEVRHEYCAFRVDDQRHQFTNVRRMCELDTCDSINHRCCGGLRCDVGKCVPIRSPKDSGYDGD